MARLEEDYGNQTTISGLNEILKSYPDKGTSTIFTSVRKTKLPEMITIEEFLKSTFISGEGDAPEILAKESVKLPLQSQPATRRKMAGIRYPKLLPGT